MTKVEELARQVLNEVIHVDRLLSQAGAEYEVNLVQSLVSAAHAKGVAEGAEGIMSCPLYTHGWANDDDRRGEVHCCNRKGHEMSWNPAEMKRALQRAGIDPDDTVLAPTKEKP